MTKPSLGNKSPFGLVKSVLSDAPPEIELSCYKRIPSLGNESPFWLVDRERLHVEAIPDLDMFFERLYSY
ncbi:hypothetical protein LIER_43245 [Lithospermum erythrorhizon]|uniref:Uncharacterized protein n=1 Tax=Lithospermum erythrorhizon TaxID=34254 RepID=A0AAV3PUR4_LITER